VKSVSERPLIVACIPAFNEEKTIAKVVLLAQRYADKVVVCDDGSNDMTAEIAERLGVQVIRHETNMGKGMALKSLLKEALKLDPMVVVTLDADGQHDPLEIKSIMAPIADGEADVVVGSRFVGKSNSDAPLYRRAGLRIINWLSKSVGNSNVMDTQSGFRAYSPKAASIVAMCESNGYGVELEQLAKVVENGLKIVEVPISVRYKGLEKTSKKHPLFHGGQLISTLLRLIVEERPLLFLGIPGFVSLLIGALFGVWMLQIYAVEHQIPTNIALASIAFTLIGMFAVFTGIMLYAITRLTQKINRKR